MYICRAAEKVVRQMSNNIKCKNPTKFLEIKILSTWAFVFWVGIRVTWKRKSTIVSPMHSAKKWDRFGPLYLDGVPSNVTVCTELGANYNVDNNFTTYFSLPDKDIKIYTFFHVYHIIIKLVRNTLGDKNEIIESGK